MVNHVVLFKLKDFESEDLKAVVRNKITKALLELKEKVKMLKSIEVGQHHKLNSSSYDICLITRFKSFSDLEAYAVHPEHLKVLELIKANTSHKAVVDFES